MRRPPGEPGAQFAELRERFSGTRNFESAQGRSFAGAELHGDRPVRGRPDRPSPDRLSGGGARVSRCRIEVLASLRNRNRPGAEARPPEGDFDRQANAVLPGAPVGAASPLLSTSAVGHGVVVVRTAVTVVDAMR